ncbi:MAG: PTS sugar transporter subunit IIA [candidate division Zixibacteria bacterium]|nr:PTS sugar transporter subunit IIA [candidate division Zixibacteria bacterium]
MSMNLSRYLSEDVIKLEMETIIEPFEEGTSISKWQQNCKEKILDELVTLIEKGNRIGNRTKLLLDFINREKKATTGIGYGIAIPHIRSMQAKDFILAFARSHEGYDFNSLDRKRTHLFFVMAAPPYDDNLYLKAFKSLTEIVQYESVREELMHATSPGEIIRIIRNFN